MMMEEEKHCKISQSIAVCLCVYADFRSCGWLIRRWCCSALWPVSVRMPRSKWLRDMKRVSAHGSYGKCLRVCLPLQAVRGAAAGFHLHFHPEAQWSEGQAAGQSLQTSAWTQEGPAEGESGTVRAELDVAHPCVCQVCDCRLVVFQLMCMYNFVKDEASPSFTDLPSETLLYYRRVTHLRLSICFYLNENDRETSIAVIIIARKMYL